jgi:C4-dicarboxylate transporter DctM subunit
MGVSGVLTFGLIRGSFGPALSLFGTETVSKVASLELSVVPLFLLMGAFATFGGLSADLYRIAYAFIGHVRGGLAIATIGGCAGFGAICGSSIATATTMTRVALPEMMNRKYSESPGNGLHRGRRHTGHADPAFDHPGALWCLDGSNSSRRCSWPR